MERVRPQPGQGSPVVARKIQVLGSVILPTWREGAPGVEGLKITAPPRMIEQSIRIIK
jgi:hypothetical protein